MSDNRELLERCCQMMNEVQKVEKYSNYALSPSIILFFGSVTYQYRQHIKGVLDSNLVNGEYFQYLYVHKERENLHVTDIQTGMDYGTIAEAIESAALVMLGTEEEVFKNKDNIFLECLLCTSESYAMEYYEQYLLISEPYGCNLIKTLYLMIAQEKESYKFDAQKLIDRILEEQKSKKQNIYFLSNLLNGGSLLLENRIWMNYRLVADLILLGNSRVAVREFECTNYVSMVRDGLMTAAYSFMGKPINDITGVTLYALMKKIYEKEELAVHYTSLIDKLEQKEEDKFWIPIFQNEFADKKPETKALQRLAWTDRKEYKLFLRNASFDWDKLNQLTCGIWEVFYHEQYENPMLQKLNNEAFQDSFREKIHEFLIKKFSFFEVLFYFKGEQWKETIRDFIKEIKPRKSNTMERKLETLALNTMEMVFLKWAYDIMEEEIIKLYNQAHMLQQKYFELMNKNSKANVEGDSTYEQLKQYYEKQVGQYVDSLNDSSIFKMDTSIEKVLEEICSHFGEMIESQEIYAEPFERELSKRLEDVSEERKRIIIRNRLEDDISSLSRLRLMREYKETKVGSFCLASPNSLYEEEIKANEQNSPYIFYNLNRRDCLEMIELYNLENINDISL